MNKFDKVDGTTVFVRFLAGALLGGILVVFAHPLRSWPLWLAIAVPVITGVLTMVGSGRARRAYWALAQKRISVTGRAGLLSLSTIPEGQEP